MVWKGGLEICFELLELLCKGSLRRRRCHRGRSGFGVLFACTVVWLLIISIAVELHLLLAGSCPSWSPPRSASWGLDSCIVLLCLGLEISIVSLSLSRIRRDIAITVGFFLLDRLSGRARPFALLRSRRGSSSYSIALRCGCSSTRGCPISWRRRSDVGLFVLRHCRERGGGRATFGRHRETWKRKATRSEQRESNGETSDPDSRDFATTVCERGEQ